MNFSLNNEQFRQRYQAGKDALERGNYSLSIQQLEAARELIPPNSRTGGEAQLWLVSAYQAAQKTPEAIALCRELFKHPNPDIRDKSKRLLYIIEAPRLQRPQKWMSQIPDLTSLEDTPRLSLTRPPRKPRSEQPKLDLTCPEEDPRDNQFLGVAFCLLIVIFASFFWWSSRS